MASLFPIYSFVTHKHSDLWFRAKGLRIKTKTYNDSLVEIERSRKAVNLLKLESKLGKS